MKGHQLEEGDHLEGWVKNTKRNSSEQAVKQANSVSGYFCSQKQLNLNLPQMKHLNPTGLTHP